ncbi:MAG: lactonase family protein [Solirubrobacteraceae bacterium]
MRIHKVRVVKSSSLALGALAVTAAAASAAPPSPVVGHVYVDGNTPVANTVAELDRHADGSLTPNPGSPFAVGGAGTGAGLASQGAIQSAYHGRYLLAVDAGSNQISVLRVGWNGSPTEVGAPVSSGGVSPNSIAVHGDLVYVANSGSPNYTGFRLTRRGQLLPISNSTVTVPSGSSLGDVLFNSTGTNLVGTEVASSEIDSFKVRADGRLQAAMGSPYIGQGLGQLGAEFNPANPSQLFVTNAHNGVGLGTVSSYRVGFFGSLTPVSASPFADGQTAPCWVEVSHDGKYLFAINTGSKNISSYSIDSFGQLTLVSSFPISGSAGGDIDARLSPDGRSLFVVGGKSDVVSAFAVNGGTLSEYVSSPAALPAGELAPSGIVVN